MELRKFKATEKQFFLELMSFENIMVFAARVGHRVTDGRLRVPGIADDLSRKRSLGMDVILSALESGELEKACARLGLVSADEAAKTRAALLDALAGATVRQLIRAAAAQHHDLVAIPAKLLEVVDGDTIRVLMEGTEHWVRIRGIDTPETRVSDKAERDMDHLHGSAMWRIGERATKRLEQLLSGRSLYLECQPTPSGTDKYLYHNRHRLLCFVRLDSPDGPDVGEVLLREGHALVWPRNLKTRRYLHPRSESYVATCHDALRQRPGLWEHGLEKLCPCVQAARPAWTLEDCKTSCYRWDWQELSAASKDDLGADADDLT